MIHSLSLASIPTSATYPLPSQPLQTFFLPVGNKHDDQQHHIYVHTYGNPNGIPVVRLHGGPGSGSDADQAIVFNPQKYFIILFDQRGCGRNKWPQQSLRGRTVANTTAHLMADMEAIRQHLGVQKWLVTGYSWGSTLALAYAQAHAQHVLGLIVGGVLLATRAEKNWFTNPNGLPQFVPQAYADLLSLLPANTPPANMAQTSLKIMLGNDPERAAKLVRAWSRFEMMAACTETDADKLETMLNNPTWLLGHSVLEGHYISHQWFLSEGQLLANMGALQGKPLHIIQADRDLICPPMAAHALYQAAENAGINVRLDMLVGAGHSGHPLRDFAMRQAADNMLNLL